MGMPVRDLATTRTTDGHTIRSWYRQQPSAARPTGVVAWTWLGEAAWPRPLRLIPDGCVDVSWDGHAVTVTPAVAAPLIVPLVANGVTAGVRLRPHAAVAVLGRPAPTLTDPVPLADLWPRDEVDRLLADLDGTTPADAGVRLGDAIARHARRPENRPDPLLAALVARLANSATVADAAHEVGASTRDLRRRCRVDLALAPKDLHEILRLHRALRVLGHRGLASVAAEAGYCDQAHLSRQTRKLAGTTPSRLARDRSHRGDTGSDPVRGALP
jgi:AraC-like DNA-binding protein